MKRNILISIVSALILISNVNAQEQEIIRNPHPMGRWFGISVFEMQLANGEFVNNGMKWTPHTRFIPFFNLQSQAHYNGKHLGIFTGIGIRNIGFRHSLQRDSLSTLWLKQRAYSLNIPLGIKIGNPAKGRYLAFGTETHYLFHYKSKLTEDNKTNKHRDWFSSRMNLLNLSAFIDLRFKNGSYFKINYFIFDFLSEQSYNTALPKSGENFLFKPEKSSLIYFSFGTALKVKKKQPLTLNDV